MSSRRRSPRGADSSLRALLDRQRVATRFTDLLVAGPTPKASIPFVSSDRCTQLGHKLGNAPRLNRLAAELEGHDPRPRPPCSEQEPSLAVAARVRLVVEDQRPYGHQESGDRVRLADHLVDMVLEPSQILVGSVWALEHQHPHHRPTTTACPSAEGALRSGNEPWRCPPACSRARFTPVSGASRARASSWCRSSGSIPGRPARPRPSPSPLAGGTARAGAA
jgi:hypothetical protein